MKILVLDNYDSFTYNLVQYLKELTDAQIDVFRNDKISLEDVGKYDKIALSPGPGIPDEAGILKPLIKTYGPTKSIFGVCLGLQAITEVYGGRIYNLDHVYHGVASEMTVVDTMDPLFKGISRQFVAGRYHSWVADEKNMPECLKVTAVDEQGEVMAIRHRDYDVSAVQFHPESVLTPLGKQILANWLNQ